MTGFLKMALLGMVVALSAFCSSAQSIGTGTSTHTIQFGGRTRSFIVNNPGGNATGLFMLFHGFTNTASTMCRQSDAASIGASNSFVSVCPQGIANSWNAGRCCGGNSQDDVGFSKAVVDYVTGALEAIDSTKVFAGGFSNGGMLSYRLICEASDVFYGAAPGAGEYYGNSLLGYTCNPPVQRPVLHMHGTADLVINYVLASNAYQDYVRNVQGCPITTSFKYGNPLYYAMTCVERSPCNGNTASTHCTYNLMGHQWPTNGLLRAWNYFTTGRL